MCVLVGEAGRQKEPEPFAQRLHIGLVFEYEQQQQVLVHDFGAFRVQHQVFEDRVDQLEELSLGEEAHGAFSLDDFLVEADDQVFQVQLFVGQLAELQVLVEELCDGPDELRGFGRDSDQLF